MLTDKVIKLGRQTVENQDFFSTAEMAKLIANDLNQVGATVLEPSVGSGTLIWSLLEKHSSIIISVNDIEEDYLQYVASEAKARGYKASVLDGLFTISN